jgi:hypothetical protein
MSGTLQLGLNPNDIVSISLVISSAGVPVTNFGAAMAIGHSSVIDVVQRQRVYTTLTAVANDFGTTAPEFLAAELFFGQNINGTFYIGRWAMTATPAILHGGIFNAAQQAALITSLAAISTGSMTISFAGAAHALTALNFSGVVTLPGAAAILSTALSAVATVTWNSVIGRFDVISLATGVAATISFAATTGSGIDVSSLLNLTAATGASLVQGIAAETALTALSILSAFPSYMIGFALAATTDLQNSDYEACAGFMEATQKTFAVATQDANVLGSGTTDIAAILSDLAFTRTWIQYSSSNLNPQFAWMGISSTVNFNEQNSTLTMKFKVEIGIAPEVLNETQAANVNAKNCNVQVSYSNGSDFLQQGVMCSGLFFDIRIGADWQANDLQVTLFNRLVSSLKIPQTDQGLHIFVTDATASMMRGVNNGLTAPGVWNETITFGTLTQGATLTTGFYIFMPPVASQSIAARDARQAPPMQIAMKLAGAVHSASATIFINQ